MPALPTGAVTFLFTDIEGSTARWEHQPDAMKLALAHHDRLLQQTIEAHKGIVFKKVGDAFCVAFAQAADAASAALAAQRAIAAQDWHGVGPLRVRMALHTGVAEERDGDYFGPTLNRVARLLAAGHGGQTLLSLATADLVRSALPGGAGLRDLGKYRLRDLIQPEQVFQLVSTDSPEEFPPLRSRKDHPRHLAIQDGEFIGRERERATLAARFEGARRGIGAVVTIGGEPGVGKTRLVEEFIKDLDQQAATVLRGRCYEGEWVPPYGPWTEALRGAIRNITPDRLSEQLVPWAPTLSRLAPEVREVLPDTALAPPLSPEEGRFRLHDAVTQFLLAAASARPLVLLLDDLHWADRDSLGLLRHLARFVDRAGLLLIGTYRDTELDHRHTLADVLASVRREAPYEPILLRGLSEREVAEFLAHIVGPASPEPLGRALHAETRGNPFYLGELCRHLIEEGRLIDRSGRWVVEPEIGALGIPEGVRQVVRRRLSRLSAETNDFLRVAAAFTGGFEFRTIEALTELPEPTLLDCIDEALQSQLLCPADDRPGMETYDFAHAIVRHTIYDELSPSRRVRLHRRIAEAFERLGLHGAPTHVAELALQYHASAALPGVERGVPYALTAAEQATAAYAHERAVLFLRIARDLVPETALETRADILCRLAVAEAAVPMLAEAEYTVEQARAALAAVGAPSSEVAHFLEVAARALKETGARRTVWEPLVAHGLALTGAQHDLTWARLMLLCDPIEPLSIGAINAGRWQGFDAAAVAIARSDGLDDDYARTLEPFDWRTREETDALLAYARTWHSPLAVMKALNTGARELLYRHGAFREAVAVSRELQVTAERYGSIPQQAEALYLGVGAHAALGEFAQARETHRRGQEVRSRLGTEHRVRTLNSLLPHYLDDGWEALIEALRSQLADPSSARLPIMLANAGWLALAFERVGATAEARQLLEVLTPLLEQLEPTAWVHNGAVSQAATAVWHLGETAYAARYRALALAQLAASVADFPTTSNELTVARMAALLGDIDAAQEYFGRARCALQTSGQRPLCAMVDYDEALTLVRGGTRDHDRIDGLLDAALTGFRDLGMEGWCQRTLKTRAALPRGRISSRRRAGYPDGLTGREIEVLRLLAAGKSNDEIAAALVLSVRTVERHVGSVYERINVHGQGARAAATAYALRRGLAESS
jgi:class 3 adenylate cyclase/DNA-binding CsgD family transcriptional regulator